MAPPNDNDPVSIPHELLVRLVKGVEDVGKSGSQIEGMTEKLQSLETTVETLQQHIIGDPTTEGISGRLRWAEKQLTAIRWIAAAIILALIGLLADNIGDRFSGPGVAQEAHAADTTHATPAKGDDRDPERRTD